MHTEKQALHQCVKSVILTAIGSYILNRTPAIFKTIDLDTGTQQFVLAFKFAVRSHLILQHLLYYILDIYSNSGGDANVLH